jgi:1-acyl-sn-glycerol-3-phosphate acyltransferase
MRALGRLLIHVFFRRVEVNGVERLPEQGPVLIVANHTNGLVDGLLLLAMLRRYPRFLGKATLFRILPLKPLLQLAGVVPVYRAKDGEGTARNDATFRTCRELLARGGVVAIFPEGISHDELMLQPLRTGAARIALGAAFDAHADGLVIAPIGLAYDAKARFRSRALVTVGAPLPVEPWKARYDDDPRGAAHELTDAIGDVLRSVGPDYRTVEEAERLADIADVAVLDAGGLPRAAPLHDRERVARVLARARPDRLAVLREAYDTYARDLALLGVSDADVAAAVTPGRYRSAIAWGAAKVVVAAPFALAGFVIHVLPYQLIKRLSRRPRNEGVKSTVKILGSFALFTIEYIVFAALAWSRWGAPASVTVFVLCPVAGYATVRFAERIGAGGGLRHGYRTLRSRHATLVSVRANRSRVVDLARSLVES